MLPLLIAEQLRRHLGACRADVRIPLLRIRVPAKLDELERATTLQAVDGVEPAQSPLEQRIRSQIQLACGAINFEAPGDHEQARLASKRNRKLPEPALLVQELLTQYRDGIVFRVLRGLPASTLVRWERMLRLAVADTHGPERNVSPEFASRLMSMLERQLESRNRLRNEPRARVAVMTALLSHYEAGISVHSIDDFLERYLDPVSLTEIDSAFADARGRIVVDETISESPPQACDVVLSEPSTVAVPTVLPFIVTGVLSRCGVLDTLAVALHAAAAPDDAACFAVAIAYKVGAPPLRGWRRDPATKTLAAAMTGTGEVPTNAHMASFLDRFDETAGVLVATRAARRAKERKDALWLLLDRKAVRGTDVWTLVDVADGRPVAWLRDERACLDFMQSCGNILLLINRPAAKAKVLERLHERDIAWITNTSPDAANRWSRPSAALRLWTNKPDVLCPIAATTVGAFTQRIADSALTQAAFLEQRPLLLPADRYQLRDAELELSSVIASACGEVAARLWADEAHVEPLLTIQRFGDLDGTVKFEDDRVLVTPALGKRYMDLHRNDFFRDVTNVPWLDGRVLQFGGL